MSHRADCPAYLSYQPENWDCTCGERQGEAQKARSLAHHAVTEGVNLKYVDLMRRELYALADALDAAEAQLAQAKRGFRILETFAFAVGGAADVPEYVRADAKATRREALAALADQGASDE